MDIFCSIIHLKKIFPVGKHVYYVTVTAGKGFVEAVKQKTDTELDEEVRLESEPVQEDPTLKPFVGFSAEQDCEVLMKAMKGFGK